MGKLNKISLLSPALETFPSEAAFMMRNHISSLMQEDGSITDKMRSSYSCVPSPEVSQDLLMVGAVMTDTYDKPTPHHRP
jgi:hypothetical protein